MPSRPACLVLGLGLGSLLIHPICDVLASILCGERAGRLFH